MHRIVVLCFVGWIASASAITVQDYTVAEAAPFGLDWSHVHNYKGSSAVAVGGYWMLTAAHVAIEGGTGALSIDGGIYNQQEIVYHGSADLALVRYDKAFPGYYSLYTGNLLPQDADPKLSVLMVGYGTIGSVFPTFWTDSGSGRGTKRWGSQEIDKTAIRRYKVGDAFTANNGFWMDFDLGNTVYEAGAGVGDSGGGTFYNEGGIWKLAGINTLIAGSGGEYSSTFAVSMPDYAGWVVETIPEPGIASLMGLSTVGLFLSRSKRRRNLAGGSLFLIGRESLCDTFCPLEERVVDRGGLDYMTGLRQAMEVRLLPAWNKVHIWYKGLNKVFWGYMVVSHERKIARRNAIKSVLKKKTINGFDAFLALVMK